MRCQSVFMELVTKLRGDMFKLKGMEEVAIKNSADAFKKLAQEQLNLNLSEITNESLLKVFEEVLKVYSETMYQQHKDAVEVDKRGLSFPHNPINL